MIPSPLDSSSMEGDRAMLEPENASWLLDVRSPPWFGKRATKAVPLTDGAVKAWITSGAIVPPIGSRERPAVSAWMGVAWLILVAAAIVPWLIVPFGR